MQSAFEWVFFWTLGRLFFCFSQIRRPHTQNQRPKQQPLVLSLRAGYTRLRDQKKHTEHKRNAKRLRISVAFSIKRGPGIVLVEWITSFQCVYVLLYI